jgi:probable F420-dependent oxidoreductase
MKFWLSLIFEPHQQLLDLARMAEELGFEGVVLPDHVVMLDAERTPHPTGTIHHPEDPYVDPLIAFGAMATVTQRLRFLTYILVVPMRDPFLLAKQLTTAALLTNNRVVLGTGVGWLKEEFATVGRGFSDRGSRFEEMLAIMTDFWHDGYAEYHGQHFDFDRSGMFPAPTRSIPIWIGGHSMAAARRAAQFEGYMPMREVADQSRSIDDESRAEFERIELERSRAGLSGPYERIVPWWGTDPSVVAHLAEQDSITSLVVFPWQLSPDLSLTEKRSAAETFAERIMKG